MSRDIYAETTDAIVAQIEAGAAPWRCPWTHDGRSPLPRRHDGTPYQGINVLVLWSSAARAGYSSDRWLTYRQAQALGGHVRKGERGTTVVYAGAIQRTETDETGEESTARIPFLKRYSVFCADQVDGLDAEYYAQPVERIGDDERDARADAWFAAIGADVSHGGNRAFYSPMNDAIRMPPFGAFEDGGAYYGTLAHEHVHWTKHARRLDRDFGGKRFGDDGYAVEELVAEIGAAFVCAQLGLSATPRDDHASYLASWLRVLKADKRAIFTAASHAQRAAVFLDEMARAGAADADATAVAA